MQQLNLQTVNERQIAAESLRSLNSVLKRLTLENPEIEILQADTKIKIPIRALKSLSEILKAVSLGKAYALVEVSDQVTTQKAAELLYCSRPHVVKLLEEGEISYTKVGKHRRLNLEDVLDYKRKIKERQKQHLIAMMKADEESGLYES